MVSDPQLRADAVLAVARRAAELDWHTVDVTASPLPGPSGNVEYFLHLRVAPDQPLTGDALEQAVQQRRRGGAAMTTNARSCWSCTPDATRPPKPPAGCKKMLGDNGIGLRVLAAEAVDRGPLYLAPDEMRALGVEIEVVDADERAAEGCELVLVLGGDGTFLRAAELARNVEIPVLGVNLGRIGFLAEAEADSIDTVLDHVVNRDYRVEERMTLDVVVRVDGRIADRGWALNEASLEKGPRLGVLGRGARGRRPAGVVVRLRRRARVDADRIHRVRVLRGRPDPVAGSRGDPGGAQQRSRTVRPPDGHQPERRDRDRDRGGRPRRPGVLRRPPGDGGARRRPARGDPLRHAAEVGAAGQRAVHRPAGAQVPAAGHGMARAVVLSEIRIESLGAISAATAEFDRGLTVLTGETGTGKTMVVTGLHLLGGARADATRVRSGADRAVVEGRFTTAELGDGVGSPGRRDPRLLGRRARRRRQRHRRAVGQPRRAVAGLSRRPQRAGEVVEHLHHRTADPARPERPAAADARRRTAGRAGPVRRRRPTAGAVSHACATTGWPPAATSPTARSGHGNSRRRPTGCKFGLDEIDAVDPQARRGRRARRRHPPAVRTRRAARGRADRARALVRCARRRRRRGCGVGGSTESGRRSRRWRPPTTPRCGRWATGSAEALAVIGDVSTELGDYLTELPSDASTLETKLARQGELRVADPQVRRRHRRCAGVGRASRASGWRSSTSPRRRSRGWRIRSTSWKPKLVGGRNRTHARCAPRPPRRLAKAVTAELSGLAMADAEFTIAVAPLTVAADDSAPLTLPSGDDGACRVRRRRRRRVRLHAHIAGPTCCR